MPVELRRYFWVLKEFTEERVRWGGTSWGDHRPLWRPDLFGVESHHSRLFNDKPRMQPNFPVSESKDTDVEKSKPITCGIHFTTTILCLQCLHIHRALSVPVDGICRARITFSPMKMHQHVAAWSSPVLVILSWRGCCPVIYLWGKR